MKISGPSHVACAVFLTSAIMWILGISWILVHFLGLSQGSGWLIAGSLGISCMVAVGVIWYEMRHSAEIAPRAVLSELEGFPLPSSWKVAGNPLKHA